MDSVLQAVLESPQATAPQPRQLGLFDELDTVKEKELAASHAIEEAAQREKASRTIFAQNAIKAEEIEQDLQESDEAIGTPEAVERFVTEALLNMLGVQITRDRDKKGYNLFTDNMPGVLQSVLPEENPIKVSFVSPTPEGYRYFGRNHPFVEQLCQFLMANSLSKKHKYGPARSAIIRCSDVTKKTTLLLFRVRNVIEAKKGGRQLVAEEMLIWGFSGSVDEKNWLSREQTEKLLHHAVPSSDLSSQARSSFLENELEEIEELHGLGILDQVALKRAEILLEAHERFRKLLKGGRYKVVEPVLPMDLMGVYVLLPEKNG